MPSGARKKLTDMLSWSANNGIMVGGAAACVAYTISLVYGIIIPNLILLSSMFLMMWAVYRVNRVLDLEEDKINHPERVKHIHKTKNKLALWAPPVIAYCITLLLTFITSFWAFILVIISFFWILFYSLEFPKVMSKKIGVKRIKEILVIKTAYTSIAWSIVVLISAFILNKNAPIMTSIMFFFVFLRVSITSISFDMRDIRGDKAVGTKTIPVIIGPIKTKKLLYALDVISGLYILLFTYLGYLPTYTYFLALMALYGYYYISKLTERNIHFLCDVVVDGEFLIWPFLLLIGKIILRI